MPYSLVIYEAKDGIAKITLNRPEVLNALSPNVLEELKAAIEQAAQDTAVKVIVLTGAGRAFSAGVDLKANHEVPGNEPLGDGHVGPYMDGLARDLIATIETIPKVVIAMVNGFCLTGSLELVLSCDLVIAAEEALFGDTHVLWGARPSWGMSQRLPRFVGLLKAKELSFTGRMIRGDEAERIHLINRAVPLAKLEETVFDAARTIMNNSQDAIAAYKYLFKEGRELTLEEGLELEAKSAFVIRDNEERVARFKKRS